MLDNCKKKMKKQAESLPDASISIWHKSFTEWLSSTRISKKLASHADFHNFFTLSLVFPVRYCLFSHIFVKYIHQLA